MSKTSPADYLIAGTSQEVVDSYAGLAERAETARFGLLEQEYVVIDTETTGLKPEDDELIEIAAAIMDGPEVIDTFQTFVDPGRPISEFITDLTSISDGDVAGAPSPEEAVAMLQDFVGNRTLIAHNARFDRAFVAKYAGKGSVLSDPGRWIDSLALSRIAMPRLVSHDQPTMCDAFGIERGGHRAIGDVLALCRLWRIMLVALSDMPHDMLGFIGQIAPAAEWPLRDVICTIAADGMDRRFSMYAMRDRQIADDAAGSEHMIDPNSDFFDMKEITEDEIREAFSEDGIVGSMYENFEDRPEQVEYALNVAEAFQTSTHRVIEAGTGVGKSVSYLLPSAMFSMRNNVRVGIATKTNTLLDQLVFHELPLLQRAMLEKTGRTFSFIALKGYDHYPCLRKVMRFAREADESTALYDIEVLAMVITAISQSTWGDLDALSVSLSHYARANIVCSPDECMHGKCPFYPKRCLLHGARRRANDSQIVVTNHALLFRDAASSSPIIPSIRYWVVDEAHSAEEEARDQLSYEVDSQEVSAFLSKLGSASGPIASMQKDAVKLDGGSTVIGLASAALNQVEPLVGMVDSFFSSVKGLGSLVKKSSYATSDIWINAERRESEAWQKVLDMGEPMLQQLDSFVRSCQHLLSMSEEFEELSEQGTELSSAINRLSGYLEGISLILDGSDDDYYYYAKVRHDKSRKGEVLCASLVEVGGELADRFFSEENSVVFTSATLAVGDSFDYFAHRIGLDRLEDQMWEGRKLDPPDEFYANMRTLVVNGLPDPRANDYVDELSTFLLDVHLALGGGVLTLFTNRREMQRVYEQISPAIKQAGGELLCQSGGKSKRALKDDFIRKENSSLFATRSFWEGFDAPGRALKCVVLPKLPFSRPDDPLYQERSARTNDAWKAYVLPQAIIDTKQAAGRLIRSKSDSGFLILCDNRLNTMWYGKLFLKSLPQPTIEKVDAADVKGILERSEL